MVRSAFEFAHEYIKNGMDYPRNTKNGNMKLQKLLYFSQLVHYAEFGNPLFKDPIYAYENGCIIDGVMNDYYYDHDAFIACAHQSDHSFTPEEKFTMELVESVFGEKSAKELSDLNHEHGCWKLAYGRSYVNENYKEKSLSKVEKDEIFDNDINGIKKVVDGFKSSNESLAEAVFVLGGTEFYYDPREIVIDEELKSYLDNFVGEDEAFSIYKDSSQGVVVY